MGVVLENDVMTMKQCTNYIIWCSPDEDNTTRASQISHVRTALPRPLPMRRRPWDCFVQCAPERQTFSRVAFRIPIGTAPLVAAAKNKRTFPNERTFLYLSLGAATPLVEETVEESLPAWLNRVLEIDHSSTSSLQDHLGVRRSLPNRAQQPRYDGCPLCSRRA